VIPLSAMCKKHFPTSIHLLFLSAVGRRTLLVTGADIMQ
jgi:hypothetical protein